MDIIIMKYIKHVLNKIKSILIRQIKLILVLALLLKGKNNIFDYSTMTCQIIITIINKIVKISSIKKEIEVIIYANCWTSWNNF